MEGRDTITLQERTRLDESYVDRQTIGLDMSILLRTATAVFRNPGE